MLRRLRIYFTGVGIGLIMVYLMFGRDDSRDLDIWTPSQRILEEIRNDSILQNSGQLACFKACLNLTEDEMTEFWTESSVKSLNPGGDPYRYLISLKTDERHLEAELEKAGEQYILQFVKDNQNPVACTCDE